MNKKERLKKEIADLQRKLEELESENGCIKKLEDYTTSEKVEFFDKMYNSALEELEELKEKGYSDEDNAQYAWEEYITILAKDKEDFWKYWNSLSY